MDERSTREEHCHHRREGLVEFNGCLTDHSSSEALTFSYSSSLHTMKEALLMGSAIAVAGGALCATASTKSTGDANDGDVSTRPPFT